ncbi:MAG: 5'-nucleotidase C-terminal domain-containing protein [Bacteroidaceae bacterium]|nr:5'-nucleotidase C-terminal domain-containing protein [Bacteroidaceae bacterium]
MKRPFDLHFLRPTSFCRETMTVLCVLFLTGCKSHHYVLQSVQPQRIEITKALDKNPLPAAETFVLPYRAGVDSLRAPRVGESAQYMSAKRPESLLSNWVADALVATGQRMGYQVDLGICNIGGLRAAMPKGTVTRGDILAISPFENFFTILKMKGSDVQTLMQDIAAVRGEGVSSGARLVITSDGQLKSATLGGQPIDPSRTYTIATLDYLADGNDKLYSLKRSTERIVTKEPVRETLMNHLLLLDGQGKKAEAKMEGRITITDNTASIDAPYAHSSGEGTNASNGPALPSTETTISSLLGKTGGEAPLSLLLVHTNDTHSCIEPLSPLLADTAQADKGGYLRRAALLRDLRQHDKDLLLVDAGDFSQGSAYYSLYHGDVEVGLMNLMGYDAATIGNHEFDFGLENMARIFKQARFPIVCCNYDFSGTPVEGLTRPYIIIKRAGLKIGILGVSPQLEGLVAAHTCEGVRYTDPIEAAQPMADYLKMEEKCDLVVCLSHLGWNTAGVSDEELIPATRNIDIVIGGHSHTYFTKPQVLKNLDGQEVPDNQMGKNARYVGTLRLGFHSK